MPRRGKRRGSRRRRMTSVNPGRISDDAGRPLSLPPSSTLRGPYKRYASLREVITLLTGNRLITLRRVICNIIAGSSTP
eukprot:2138097-Pyramimonas_sp.AAC.1